MKQPQRIHYKTMRNFFTFLNRLIWARIYCFAKRFFYFDLTWSSTLNFESFPIILNTILNICFWLNINWFHLIVQWYVLLYLSTISSLININIFWYHSYMLVDLTLQSSNKSLYNNRFPFIVCWNLFNTLEIMQPLPYWSIVKLTTLIYPYLASFMPRPIQNSLKCLGDCNTFSVFQWNNPGLFVAYINNT